MVVKQNNKERKGTGRTNPKEIQAQSAKGGTIIDPPLNTVTRSGYYRLVTGLRGDMDSVGYAKKEGA